MKEGNKFNHMIRLSAMKKEIIALDIDGTLTSDLHSLPKEVERYLKKISEDGTDVVLITGRCFSLAYPPIKDWDFTYKLAVHNGAVILQMPEKRIISKQYIDVSVMTVLDKIVQTEETDFGLYTGIENQDVCYFRPDRFSERLREYVRSRAKICRENWLEVESFEGLPLDCLTAIKFFGDQSSTERIKQQVEDKLGLHIPVIRDPIDESVFLAQATHPQVDKGSAVDRVKEGQKSFVIAAGDDLNDLPMLEKADVKIVMESAPSSLKAIADIIAKPAKNHGIIEAIDNARNSRI